MKVLLVICALVVAVGCAAQDDGQATGPSVKRPQTVPTATERPQTVPTATERPQTVPTATERPQTVPTATERPTAIPTATERPQAVPTATERPPAFRTAVPTPVPPTNPPPWSREATAAALDYLSELDWSRLFIKVGHGNDGKDVTPTVEVAGPFWEGYEGITRVKVRLLVGTFGSDKAKVQDYVHDGLPILVPTHRRSVRSGEYHVLRPDVRAGDPIGRFDDITVEAGFWLSEQDHKYVRCFTQTSRRFYACVAEGDTPYW